MTQKLYQTIYADPGITRDGTQFDAPTYVAGTWVRFYKKRPQKIGGYLMLNQGTTQIPRSVFLVQNSVTNTTIPTDVDIYAGYQGVAGGTQAVIVYPLNVENNTTGVPIDRIPGNNLPIYIPSLANVWTFSTIYGSVGGTDTNLQNQEFILAHVAPIANTLSSPYTGQQPNSVGQIYYGLAQNYSPSYVPLVPMMQNGTPFSVTTPARTDFQSADNGICVIGGYIFALNNDGVVNWNTAFPATGVISDPDNRVSPFPTQYCMNYWNQNSFFVIGSEDFIYGAPVRVGADIGGLFWTGASLVRAVKTPVDQSLVPQPNPLYLLSPQTLNPGATLIPPITSGFVPQQITINITFTGTLGGSPAVITLTVNGTDQNNNILNDQLIYIAPGSQTTVHTYKTVTSITASAFTYTGSSNPIVTSILSSYLNNNQDPGLYTWVASYVSTISTCISSRSIISYEPFFFWVGTDSFYQYNGAVSPVVNETNKQWFFDNLNPNAKSKITSFVNLQFNEWWILFPMGTATECNWALVYNIDYQTWFDTPNINRSCAIRSNSLYPYPIMGSSVLDVNVSPNYPIFAHEYGYDGVYGNNIPNVPIPSSFTTLLSLEANPPNTKNVVTLNQVTLDLDQEGLMTLAVSKFAYPRSPIPIAKTYTFLPTDTFLTMSENGTIILLTFSSNVVGGYYLMGKTIVEYIVSDSEREEPT